MIRKILDAARDSERLWIWMGIGMGFGNDDLARARPIHFDQDSYDMRRGKTGLERYGTMRPMVWAHLERYLEANPRDESDLLFKTRTGRPLVWVEAKTEDELRNGTTTHGPSAMPYKRTDSVLQAFRKLKRRAGLEDWREGFYVWRHVGATAYAAREDVGLAALRTFLGHGKSDVADQYMKPLTPQVKEVVEWVNKMLNSDDLDAWREKGPD
jgi:integrase